MRMRRVILSSVACPAVSYFSTSPRKSHDFQKKVIAHEMHVLIFSGAFVWNISHSKKNWQDIMINVHHTRHQLDLDRPVSALLIASSPVFQVTFVHSVLNLALFLPSCCCSGLLHVAANSIWNFLVSRQNFFVSFAVKKCVSSYSSEKFHLDWCQFF